MLSCVNSCVRAVQEAGCQTGQGHVVCDHQGVAYLPFVCVCVCVQVKEPGVTMPKAMMYVIITFLLLLMMMMYIIYSAYAGHVRVRAVSGRPHLPVTQFSHTTQSLCAQSLCANFPTEFQRSCFSSSSTCSPCNAQAESRHSTTS